MLGINKSISYFVTFPKHTLIVDPKNFLNDFLSGIKQYLKVLQKASVGDKVAQDFEKVFKDVFIDGK